MGGRGSSGLPPQPVREKAKEQTRIHIFEGTRAGNNLKVGS
jgi:hypothetical protein